MFHGALKNFKYKGFFVMSIINIIRTKYRHCTNQRFTLKDLYQKNFYSKLGIRQNTFDTLFKLLENQHKSFYNIIETGTSRSGIENITGDGASTFLFDAFVNYYDGLVTSIDIDQSAVTKVNSITSPKTQVICNDSIKELKNIYSNIDCLYIDSYDVDILNPLPAAEHALKEFQAIEDKINYKTIIMIDDTPISENYLPPWTEESLSELGKTKLDIKWPNGKGMLLVPYLEKKGFSKLVHEYQAIFTRDPI